MKYPYYNPNLRILDIMKAFFISKEKAENRIKTYFKTITGNKYILITNSCRTALYLAYQAADINGREIITSPLTCKVAIDPIYESGNLPVFADIDPRDLNIKPDDIEQRITSKTYAIQAIHLGGVSCDMDKITRIAKKHKLWLIEDCAQSLGAKYQGNYTGSFGDIACFSLIKNAYGIGGGILATNDENIYKKATNLSSNFGQNSTLLLMFRIIRGTLETYRRWPIVEVLFQLLMKAKGNRKSYQTVKSQLKKVSLPELKISVVQIKKLMNLHQKRLELGIEYYNQLTDLNILINKEYNPQNSSFTKLFVYNPRIKTKLLIERLNNAGIEAMHLEHSFGSPYQEMIVEKEEAKDKGLNNYLKVHDSIISLPLNENFNNQNIKHVLETLNNKLYEEKNYMV